MVFEYSKKQISIAKDFLGKKENRDAMLHAQLALEKCVKEIGKTYFNFTDEMYKSKYKHETLKLYADILKLLLLRILTPTEVKINKEYDKLFKKCLKMKNRNITSPETSLLGMYSLVKNSLSEFKGLLDEIPKGFEKLEGEKEKLWRISMGLEGVNYLKNKEIFIRIKNNLNNFYDVQSVVFEPLGLEPKSIAKRIISSEKKDDLKIIFKEIQDDLKKKFKKIKINLKSLNNLIPDMEKLIKFTKIFQDDDFIYIALIDSHQEFSRYCDSNKEMIYKEKGEEVKILLDKAENIINKLDDFTSLF